MLSKTVDNVREQNITIAKDLQAAQLEIANLKGEGAEVGEAREKRQGR